MGSPVAIDLFCGCGGLTYGMRNAGVRVLAGFDTDTKMKSIYEGNNSDSEFKIKDIRDVTSDEVIGIFDHHKGPRIIAGCAPCQPFSKINRKGGTRHKDYSLMDEFSRLVREVKPDGVLMENVQNFPVHGKQIWNYFLESLEKAGLRYSWGIVDAARFGVPQHRLRFVLLAAKEKPTIPQGTFGPHGVRPYVTVMDAISDLPSIDSGYRDSSKLQHSCKSLSLDNLKRLELTPIDGGSREDIPRKYWISTHKIHIGHSDTYGRMAWNKPAPTLTCRCVSISNGRFAHPVQNRGISIREAARLQSFPDLYIFPVSLEHAQKCIGNAVPPLMAEQLTRSLITSLLTRKRAHLEY